ncbi:hypothetical protein GYMLUDRAFT_47995 [Collybiopsis luxurians FD-317 M1]|uniref:Transmembrane protein n=1 Tax=Collybiopsis luxurians FD-317 M1 TaxID=944289 RepID=A0A0D0CB55_9AGAR|nr:hypothetical protein GYMLUDRAFT_47995 [Collybiopsis luxurians FD-317 M1]
MSTTNASCGTGYGWADNNAGIDPCVVAAMSQACNTDDHTLPPLQPGNHYNPPNLQNDTANVCTCSWAVYNLISMCTACQGAYSSLLPWASYSVGCQGFTTSSNTFFPSNIALPANASIPTYAQTNPSLWTDGVFNVTQAQQIASGTLTLPETNSTSHHSTSTAAIVGASVGGAVLLLAIIGIAVWVWRRREHEGVSTRAGSFHKLPPSGSPSSSRHSTVSVTPQFSILSRSSNGLRGTTSMRSARRPVSILDSSDFSLLREPDDQVTSRLLPVGEPIRKSPEPTAPPNGNPLIPIPYRVTYETPHVHYNDSEIQPNRREPSPVRTLPMHTEYQSLAAFMDDRYTRADPVAPPDRRTASPISIHPGQTEYQSLPVLVGHTYSAEGRMAGRTPAHRQSSSPPPYSGPHLA